MARQGQGPQQVLSSSSCTNGGGLGASRRPPNLSLIRVCEEEAKRIAPETPQGPDPKSLTGRGNAPDGKGASWERVRRAGEMGG